VVVISVVAALTDRPHRAARVPRPALVEEPAVHDMMYKTRAPTALKANMIAIEAHERAT
jgi:hypothetical protein